MRRSVRLSLTLSTLLVGAALTWPATPCGAGEAAAGGGTLVLDLERGSFRGFLRWKTPTIVKEEGEKVPLKEPKNKRVKEEDRKIIPIVAAPPPPEGWKTAGFEASLWPRVRSALFLRHWFGRETMGPGNPAEWDTVCLRGTFAVSDPAKVKDLKLHLTYYGGVAVYLNGEEIGRKYLPEGDLTPETLATAYPEQAYLRPDGKLYGERDEKEFKDRMACRTRDLGAGGLAIPAKALRKGVNVLAVEVRAAPVRDLQVGGAYAKVSWRGPPTAWAHAGVVEARLSTDSAAGLETSVGPAPGVRIYTCAPLESVEVWDYAHPEEKVSPIRLVGARNGVFSGKAVLSSAAAIKGIKASVTDLALEGGEAKIPASAIAVRRAEPARKEVSWNVAHRFDRLLSDFPFDAEPVKVSIRRKKVQPAPAAVAPIWVTVRVPADAKPGKYAGKLNVQAGGRKFEVPLRLEVHDWKVPDPKDWSMRHNLYQSPETVARYYKAEMWSDRHWELVGKSFKVLHDAGSKILVLNLTVKSPNMGNSQSMVLWIKQPDGSYKHDFKKVDRYLDVYEKAAGKPAIVCVNVWGFFSDKNKAKTPPLKVSVLDPATGKVSDVEQPPYGTPENAAFWKPVLGGLRERIEKRGWFDVTAVCFTSYCYFPTKKMVDVYHGIWSDGRWMNSSHSNPRSWKGTSVTMPVPYSEWVWGCGGLYNPDAPRSRVKVYPSPWKKGSERIEVGNPRVGTGIIGVLRDYSPLTAYRFITEAAMQGGIRGVGRVGGDFWPLDLGDKRGRLYPMCDSQFAVGPVNNSKALLSPGPDGAIFSERLEMFREGVQVSEAIVLLQKAAEAGKFDAARLKKLLDDRARHYLRTRPGQNGSWWSMECSGWQARDRELFKLAAEVAKK
ncbi:MAG: glycoside hydrolase domain-containing protein [Planctomycetota bacterium]|jgi:hypothetical protein